MICDYSFVSKKEQWQPLQQNCEYKQLYKFSSHVLVLMSIVSIKRNQTLSFVLSKGRRYTYTYIDTCVSHIPLPNSESLIPLDTIMTNCSTPDITERRTLYDK